MKLSPRRPAWAVLLVLSLCANAFFVGAALTHPPDGPPPRDGGPRDRDLPPVERMRMGMQKFLDRLPDQARGPIAAAMQANRPLVEEKMKQVEAARQASLDLVKAAPFDEAKLREALVAQRAAQTEVQAAIHESIVQALARLGAEDRRQLGDKVRRLFR